MPRVNTSALNESKISFTSCKISCFVDAASNPIYFLKTKLFPAK